MANLPRTRRARLLAVLGFFSVVYVIIGFWAGTVVEGFWGGLRIGGISLIQIILAWLFIGGFLVLVGWIWKGEPRGKQR